MLDEQGLGPPHLLVDAAERGAPIARHEARRPQALGLIASTLIEDDAYDRLRAAQEHTAGSALVAVTECIRVEIRWG
jgi:hypothetical protein